MYFPSFYNEYVFVLKLRFTKKALTLFQDINACQLACLHFEVGNGQIEAPSSGSSAASRAVHPGMSRKCQEDQAGGRRPGGPAIQQHLPIRGKQAQGYLGMGWWWVTASLRTMARWPQGAAPARPQGPMTCDILSAPRSCQVGLGLTLARLMFFRALLGCYWRIGGEAGDQDRESWSLEMGMGQRQVHLGVPGVLGLGDISSIHSFNKCLFAMSLQIRPETNMQTNRQMQAEQGVGPLQTT